MVWGILILEFKINVVKKSQKQKNKFIKYKLNYEK